MTHEEAFLRAVLDAPDDDAPRLAYADWLEERGDAPRAEFIRVQCELARLPQGAPRQAGLTTQEQALLAEHRLAWLAPAYKLGDGSPFEGCDFVRGFLERVTCGTMNWLLYGPEVMRAAPIRSVVLKDRRPLSLWEEKGGYAWLMAAGGRRLLEGEIAASECTLPPELFRSLSFSALVAGGGDKARYEKEPAAVADLSAACCRWAQSRGKP